MQASSVPTTATAVQGGSSKARCVHTYVRACACGMQELPSRSIDPGDYDRRDDRHHAAACLDSTRLPAWWDVRGGASASASSSSSSAEAPPAEAQEEGEAPPPMKDMRIPITMVSGFLGTCMIYGAMDALSFSFAR